MLFGMQNNPGQEVKSVRKVVFHRVAENLYRLESSGGYYALLKRADKQFRRSLKTKDRKLADRRLAEMKSQVTNLRITEDARLSFEAVFCTAALSFPHERNGVGLSGYSPDNGKYDRACFALV